MNQKAIVGALIGGAGAVVGGMIAQAISLGAPLNTGVAIAVAFIAYEYGSKM